MHNFDDDDGDDDDDDEGDDDADDDDGKLNVQHRREEKQNGTRTIFFEKLNSVFSVMFLFSSLHKLEHPLKIYMSQKHKS